KYPEEPAQTEGWTVLHNLRFRRIPQLLCFCKRVVQFTKAINQFVLERVFPRQDSAVGHRVSQEISRKISLLRNDAEKLVVSFHYETLHELAFLGRNRACPIKHVLKLAAFKNDGSESHFVQQLLVVEGLNNDGDAAVDRRFVRHQEFAAAGNVIAALSCNGSHVTE